MNAVNEIINYTNDLLEINNFSDYCPNGLQVEGKLKINKIITGVTACQLLINQAIDQQADMILVHHGYFWKGEAAVIAGMKKERLRSLLKHDINLAAYHLPLDAHPIYGNNIQLGHFLKIKLIKMIDIENNPNLFCIGEFSQPITVSQLSELVTRQLERVPLVERVNDKLIKKIAWCTGGAQDYISYAIKNNCDAYLTGEVSERTIHVARENGIHFFAAGHHATERYGVQALGSHLAEKFNLVHQFVDVDNQA